MAETWRLFIAVELPEEALKTLDTLQDELRRTMPESAVRWARPEGIHLTLKFLGDVPRDEINDLQGALNEAVQGHAPFGLTAEGLGAFPNTHRPRVVWVGVGGEVRRLKMLRNGVEERIAPLGYPTEDRSFNPHLTLGRVQRDASRKETDAIGEVVENSMVEELARWKVDGVSLMRSELKPTGAVYTELYKAPLRLG